MKALFCVQQDQEKEGAVECQKRKKLKKLKNLFHIDADCLCAVVTMSSEHDQQDLNDKEREDYGNQ